MRIVLILSILQVIRHLEMWINFNAATKCVVLDTQYLNRGVAKQTQPQITEQQSVSPPSADSPPARPESPAGLD